MSLVSALFRYIFLGGFFYTSRTRQRPSQNQRFRILPLQIPMLGLRSLRTNPKPMARHPPLDEASH